MEEELMRARKAVAMMLDHAVQDYEKDDKCIEAVDLAMSVLRERPNSTTIEAMKETQQ